MLLDEEKYASVNNAIRMSYEVDANNLSGRGSQSFAENSRTWAQTGNSSMLVNSKRKEPLITKAYDAFRKHKSLNKVDNLVPTEEYIDEQYQQTLVDRISMSGLKSLEKKVSTSHVQTALNDPLGESTSLPMIATAEVAELSQAEQSEMAQRVNIGTSAISSELGLSSEAAGRHSRFYTNQAMNKTAAVIDINAEVKLPDNTSKKKNKNDFYRFLLQTHSDQPDHVKINNDVFIPRSILKKSNVPGSIKEQRLEAAAEEFFEYQLAVHQMKRDNSEEYLGKYEVVFGQHLDSTNPLLSPKFKQLVQDGLDIDEFM